MLRPSDIAPKSTRYNSESGQLEPHLFTTREITFRDDGLASIVFFFMVSRTTLRDRVSTLIFLTTHILTLILFWLYRHTLRARTLNVLTLLRRFLLPFNLCSVLSRPELLPASWKTPYASLVIETKATQPKISALLEQLSQLTLGQTRNDVMKTGRWKTLQFSGITTYTRNHKRSIHMTFN